MLDKITKQSPFKVPDGYFEKLQGRVERRISGPEIRSEEAFEPRFGYKVWLRLRPILYVAAVVAITYGISFVATMYMGKFMVEEESPTLVEMSAGSNTYEEELNSYYIDEMDVYDVYEILSMNQE